ncbi:MAG: ribosome silencing factor [Planctomycetes bacterium]|nr:ribosome silencing factor [Planctomycetota bacterium]
MAHEAVAFKAEDVVALEVSDLFYLTDYFVIATTQSSRQTRALADALNLIAKEYEGHKGRIEGSSQSNWVLMDLGDVVVHLLTVEAREFYALDELWADAPRLEFAPEVVEQGSEASETLEDA